MGDEQVERRDIEALLAARQELGPAYDADLVQSFADRVERAVDQRVGATADRRHHREMMERRQMIFQFVLGAASVTAAIPISITLGVTGNYLALLIAWVGIVLVNVAHASTMRRDDR
ncbi:hypothetical protein EKO23_18510 [Nocardioides guangzhouensis]|uniref:Uncharacterized protein n=1 Tax=Nocardioides guangzhouensis TaxID=2497878 RepID=A0A4Q4Z7W2_9ACTN|nr:hypothetical protein [Nocardioides guangzhouensis]RYP83608.1 hypothetical protein EKO23_18510 [Nocardioides guangzhouensis]